MAQRLTTRLESFFEQRTDDGLRSIIKYEEDDIEVTYLRDDVDDRYSEDEIEAALDDSRMESIVAPTYDELFSDEHGELVCLVKCFEHVVEMNFILSEGEGAAVALDADAMARASGLVADAREIVIDEQS